MAENLDIDQAIVSKDPDTGEFKATPYFEDYLFKLVQDLGGEGSTDPSDSIELSLYPPDLAQYVGLVKQLRSDVAEIKACIDAMPLLARIKTITSRIDALELQIDMPINLNHIENRLASLEVETGQPINLGSVYQRLDFLEAQI